ncbi:uncharacterized protein [Aegilops tauschii subsp. strangulata]|uniref:uncharacterized protein n=1 Tax=Aegilops tauschii subsp. strangulata TaxID=200361 RepID=UPI003CC87905
MNRYSRVWRLRGDGLPPPPRTSIAGEDGTSSARGTYPRVGHVAAQSASAASSASAAPSATAASSASAAASTIVAPSTATAACARSANLRRSPQEVDEIRGCQFQSEGSDHPDGAELGTELGRARSSLCAEGVQFDPGDSVRTPCALLTPPSHRTTFAAAMNGLVWNCRGIGGSRTVRDLVTLNQVHHPRFIFLCETRQSKDRVQRLHNRLGLKGFAGVSSEGLSGGLALFWDEHLYVEIKEANQRYIDAHIGTAPGNVTWRLTCVYGEPRVENRYLMWDKMRELKAKSDLPWTVVGDFNEAIWQFEHFSLTCRAESQMEAFRGALDDCALTDLGFRGVPFTYDNKRAGRKNVRVRLDRVVANDVWRDIFPDASVEHIVTSCSDRCLLLVRFHAEQLVQNKKRCRQYEIFWERASELPEIIEQAWAAAGDKSDLEAIQNCLSNVMKSLQGWSSRKFGNILKQLKEVRTELEELLSSGADSAKVRVVQDKLNELLYKEEMLWLQRSRINWLREGDRNTKFFHGKVVWRAKKNKITKLKDANGNWISSPAELESLATAYFQDLFTRDANLNPEEIVALFENKVSVEMNEMLCQEFTDREISDALFQIGPLKAPGTDEVGFPDDHVEDLQHPEADLTKGKQVIDLSGSMPKSTHAITVAPRWEVPDANHAKLNIDGAFVKENGTLRLA